jgi:hypothetical protein
MANYENLGVEVVTEVVGAAKTRRVREYSFIAVPSETFYMYRDPPPYDVAARVDAIATDLSNRIAAVLANPIVTGAAYSQDVSASGQLEDIWTVWFATTDGLITSWVEVPQSQFTPDKVKAAIGFEIAQLEGLVGL